MICFCKCGAGLTLSHLFNCNRYISYRSTLHDAVRDQIHAMCNSYHIESFVEPLLRSLDINESVRDSEYGKRRADVVVPSFDDVMNVVDVVTVDVCKKNALKNAQSEVSPLDDSELYKRKKYANPLKELKHVRHVDYQICPFAISFSYLISLQQEIETLSPNIWAKCFPSDIVELPSRSLLSLPLTFAKLQKKILKVLENLDYIVRLSLAKEKNPVFANFLIDLDDSCSSCLISQIPNIYGLLLNDHQWTTAMRLRCFLWPCSLPNDLICRCKSVVTLSHILNCKYFITYRSLVHDSVRDQLYAMCKSFNIEAFIEPLVRKLSSDQTDDSFGKRRADLVAPGIDGVLNVVDVVSVDVCKNSAARLVYSADSPLSNAEKKKIKKYEEPLAQLGRVEHVKYQFVPFAISLFGNIGPSGLHFLENFKKVLLNRSGKTMNSTFWLNRIVFCIFKSIPTMISKALLAIGVEYERNAVSRFSNSDACLEDIEL
ncbi:hypothetical protein P9112_014478 [Eukaryota sp. TZLM1-RC]